MIEQEIWTKVEGYEPRDSAGVVVKAGDKKGGDIRYGQGFTCNGAGLSAFKSPDEQRHINGCWNDGPMSQT